MQIHLLELSTNFPDDLVGEDQEIQNQHDECYEVRERFLNKLHKGLTRGLPNKGLPLDFMGFYALMGFEENRRLKSATKHHLNTQVAKRRDYAKFMSVTNMCSIEKAMEVLPRILPDYMILFAIPVLTHSPEFTDPSDHGQLARVRNGLLSVLEPLITKNDFYCFGFYKEMIDSAKSCRDAVNPDDELTNTKMWAICDLTMALLLQKSTNFDYKDIQSETRIPAMFFKRNPDPNYVNTRTYIPLEFQYTGPIGNKKPAPQLVNINPSRRGKKTKAPASASSQHQHQMSNDAKAAETQIRLPGMESESDTEPDQPVVKKVRTKENGSLQ